MTTETLGTHSVLSKKSSPKRTTATDLVRQILVIVAFLSTVAVNVLANALPLNGQTTGELSDQFPIFITPAGYVFSIWSVIYLGLAAYVVYQALPAQRDNLTLERIAYPFVLSSIANITWIFFWHYGFVALSVVAMITLLSTLAVIYAILFPVRSVVSHVERWLVHVPFRIYLGWITVATIVNVSTLLYELDWNGWGLAEPTWAAIMLVIGAGIALFFSLALRDIAYTVVIVWAYVGIFAKYGDTSLVAWTALTLAVLVAGSLLGLFLRTPNRETISPTPNP